MTILLCYPCATVGGKVVTEWGKVTVNWWTHKIGGLHRNDFIMAARTSERYEEGQQ